MNTYRNSPHFIWLSTLSSILLVNKKRLRERGCVSHRFVVRISKFRTKMKYQFQQQSKTVGGNFIDLNRGNSDFENEFEGRDPEINYAVEFREYLFCLVWFLCFNDILIFLGYLMSKSDKCGTRPFWWVWTQGRCSDTPIGSKNASGTIIISLKRGASGDEPSPFKEG